MDFDVKVYKPPEQTTLSDFNYDKKMLSNASESPEMKHNEKLIDGIMKEHKKFDNWVDKQGLSEEAADEVRLHIVEIFSIIEKDKYKF